VVEGASGRIPSLSSRIITSSVSSEIAQEPIHETARIRQRKEMATGKLIDGHVQSFAGDAPLEVDRKESARPAIT
jgi:hypothetical protein